MEILLKVLRLFAANKNVVWRQQQSADRITGRVIQILTTARLSLLLCIHLANKRYILWKLNHKSGALQSAKWVWSHFPNTAHIPSFYVWQKADVCRSCECRICPEFTGDGDSGSMLRRRRGAGGQHQRRHNTVNIVIGDIPSHYSSANIYVTLELCPWQMEIPKKSNVDTLTKIYRYR